MILPFSSPSSAARPPLWRAAGRLAGPGAAVAVIGSLALTALTTAPAVAAAEEPAPVSAAPAVPAALLRRLEAVKAGSRDCPDGLARELEVITALGVSPASTLVEDGAGSIDSSRTSPIDQTTLLRRLLQEPWGQALRQGLPVMGVDGTEAQNQVGRPAAGRIRLKDGSRVMGSASGQVSIPAKTQVGYIEAASGRRLVYALYLNNVPTSPATLLNSFETADRDLAAIAAAFQQAL
ncbi:MAG: D-alanyl-D-alanine carboxypeptidase [Cyanobacteria bacterium]|nr:D-alanyl-D-alanine carboxypeptidase [Cyanobacteria bacterium bin.51]